jgi:hypothetical protein
MVRDPFVGSRGGTIFGQAPPSIFGREALEIPTRTAGVGLDRTRKRETFLDDRRSRGDEAGRYAPAGAPRISPPSFFPQRGSSLPMKGLAPRSPGACSADGERFAIAHTRAWAHGCGAGRAVPFLVLASCALCPSPRSAEPPDRRPWHSLAAENKRGGGGGGGNSRRGAAPTRRRQSSRTKPKNNLLKRKKREED